jgi:spermidine synthase
MALTWTRTPIPLARLKIANLIHATLRLVRREDPAARPYVIDFGDRRNLFFTDKSVQSSMKISDPADLVTPYTRKMMAFLLLNERPRHIVMIGLGGGSLAKFCYRHLPETRITVVEINAHVIALRNQFCVPADDERFQIVHGDGVAFLRANRASIDVLLVDAFDADGVAPALSESDFYDNAARCLLPHGVFVMNFSGDDTRYEPNFRQIHAAFGRRVMLVPVADDTNLLVFASKTDVGRRLLEDGDCAAAGLERQMALDFKRFLARLRTSYIPADSRLNFKS